MHNHAPKDYLCPICLAIHGQKKRKNLDCSKRYFLSRQLGDRIHQFKNFIKGNEGHASIVPFDHYENIYDLPDEVAHCLASVARKTALAVKETQQADGVNLIQNNEPAAGQHAFHYHLHIIPRFKNDKFENEFWTAEKSDPKDRVKYAEDLREWFKKSKWS